MTENRNAAMSRLADYLRKQMQQRGWKLMDTERETGVSKTAIDNILKNEDVVPTLETMNKLAGAFELPLWRIVEMAGFDLGLPMSDEALAQRLASLKRKAPEAGDVLDRLAAYDRQDVQAVLTYMELLDAKRRPPS